MPLDGAPRILANASAGASAPQCPVDAPSDARATIPDLERKADSDGLYALLGRGTLETWGLQEPTAAWADNPPRNVGVPHLLRIDAGFEMRWWSLAGDHLGASLFVFRDRRSAAEYVSEAASARCRLAAVAPGAQQGERPTRGDVGQLLRLPDGLACTLKDAGCTRSRVVPGRS